MLEQLQAVLEAEVEARRILDAARQQAAQFVRAAEEDGRRRRRDARASREDVMRSVEDRVIAEANGKAERIREQAAAQVAAIRARAEPRLEAAAQSMLRFVLGEAPS